MALYRIHEFAQLAGVTVKALHHYDRLGLLKPRRSESGYRIYVEQDLARLEQIVALKFLGIPLQQVKILLDRDALELSEALRLQRNVLEEKRRLLDRAISAITDAEKIIQSGKPPGPDMLKQIIEAIDMQTEVEDATEFMKNYYRDEAWVRFKARHSDWPSREWSDLFREITSSIEEYPGSPRVQDLAARWRKQRVRDAGGDAKVHGGLLKAWNDRQYWPEEVQNRFSGFDLERISAFIAKAFAWYRKENYGEMVWSRELEQIAPEERERFPLSVADLYFKIEQLIHLDPKGHSGQALAARWMELVESRTGSQPAGKLPSGSYESYLRWVDNWPPEIHQRLRALNMEKMGEFVLHAIACPAR
jgi:DNA-binding transcriptional MerR regulator